MCQDTSFINTSNKKLYNKNTTNKKQGRWKWIGLAIVTKNYKINFHNYMELYTLFSIISQNIYVTIQDVFIGEINSFSDSELTP